MVMDCKPFQLDSDELYICCHRPFRLPNGKYSGMIRVYELQTPEKKPNMLTNMDWCFTPEIIDPNTTTGYNSLMINGQSVDYNKLVQDLCQSRSEDEYEDDLLYEDEDEDEEEEEIAEVEEEFRYSRSSANNHLVADIVDEGENLIFMSDKLHERELTDLGRGDSRSSYESIFEGFEDNFDGGAPFYVEDCCTSSDEERDQSDVLDGYEANKEVYTTTRAASVTSDETFEQTDDHRHTQSLKNQLKEEDITQQNPEIFEYEERDNFHSTSSPQRTTSGEIGKAEIEVVQETNFTRDEKFLIFEPPKSEAKKLRSLETEKFEDTYTIGSTSKSSSDWRSSIPDSGTEDPFSSSSRRSCPKWESYTVYQKYDEEMMFLDRISAQKLHETESLRSFQVEPRSISQRIVHKLAHNKQKSSEKEYKKSYSELEAAYVAQICLAWEALNWNYANFQRKQGKSKDEEDQGCPAYIAQQFQQLQVLLQRYVENEPYERGRRPEIYARMRGVAPKLLHVPEYHDYEEAVEARIASASFLQILEEAIRTFMSFLKADRKTHCQVLADLFKRRNQTSVDPNILYVLKKHCKKKKSKLKELQRSYKIFRKRRIERREEMEILMGLIDIEVVSRVLRMKDITQEQMKWCEEKMCKVTLLEGKLQRDSSPLFFPPHSTT